MAGEVYSLPTSTKESEAANHNSVFENIRTDKRASSGPIPLTVSMLEMRKKDSARDRNRRIRPEREAEEGSYRAFNSKHCVEIT